MGDWRGRWENQIMISGEFSECGGDGRRRCDEITIYFFTFSA
jgi:hypothetical protein